MTDGFENTVWARGATERSPADKGPEVGEYVGGEVARPNFWDDQPKGVQQRQFFVLRDGQPCRPPPLDAEGLDGERERLGAAGSQARSASDGQARL